MSRSFSRNQTMTSCIIYFIYIYIYIHVYIYTCIYIYNHISISTSKPVMVRGVKLLLHSNRHGEVRLTPAYSPPVLFGPYVPILQHIETNHISYIYIYHLKPGESNFNNMSHVNFDDVHDSWYPAGISPAGKFHESHDTRGYQSTNITHESSMSIPSFSYMFI